MFNLFSERNPVCLGLEQVLEHRTGAMTSGPDESSLWAVCGSRAALCPGLIYVDIPPGVRAKHSNNVWKLQKSLYGLHHG